jgi:hypothetical protein
MLPRGGAVSKVAIPTGARLLDDGKDSVEELATGTFKTHVVAAVVGEEDVLGSARGNADMCNLDEARAEPCGGISAAVDALGDKADWVQVGRGGRPGREASSSLLRNEGLECSLAFKRWARGRCFRCLERDHQVNTCSAPSRCIRCRRPVMSSVFFGALSHLSSRSPDTRARSPDARAPC